MKIRFLALISAFLLATILSGSFAADEIDFGPFFLKDKDVYGNARWRALGPLLESRKAANGNELQAFHPFYSYAFDAAENIYRRQILYPVWLAKGRDAEVEYRFMLLWQYHDFDLNDPCSKYRLWLLPFYFQGRDMDKVRYLAIFPFVGTIREIIFLDEVRFAFFPLVWSSRTDDVKTMNVLWPILSRTTGGGNERARVFPIYGYSKLRDESDKYYVMWPIWSYARYAAPQSPGYGYVLFPFYGRIKLENQEALMILPPFFRFGSGTKQNLTYCPWPFFQYSSGEVDKLYIWPLWGQKTRDTGSYSFFLWPLCNRFVQSAPFYEHSRFMIFPFVYSSTTRGSFDDTKRSMEQPQRTLKIWPLFSYIRDTDEMRFSMLSLFPFRDYDAIERNFGSLWTIYSRAYYAGQYDDELLWGLVRYRRSEDVARFSFFPLVAVEHDRKEGGYQWSFLKGLIAREKAGGKTRIRLLYFIKF